MISFELTAIDLILVLTVIVLLILYMTKIAGTPSQKNFGQASQKVKKTQRAVSTPQQDKGKCPRGFGNIKGLDEDNSVSEECLGCYRIMECYSENNQ